MELQLEFSTEKFKLSGPLPEAINAGNQFYGEDLAEWLCKSLPQWRLTYMDEDWGWLVCSAKNSSPVDERNMICVYAYPAEDQGDSNPGYWMLTILTEYKTKWLGFLTRWKSGPYNPGFAKEVLTSLQNLGGKGRKKY